MKDQFKSDNYRENLDFLKEAIKAGDELVTIRHYNKTVRDLSQTLESFTDKAEDVAKFVICSDLNNYIEPVNKKPSGFFGIFKKTFNKILGKDASIQNNDIRNFANDKLPSLAEKITFEYLNVLKKISDLEQSKKNQEEHRLYGVNLEDRTASKQEENPLYDLQAGDSGYGSSLDEKPGYKEISNYQEKKSKILTENSQSSKSPREELIFTAGQEVRQKPKVVGTVPKSTNAQTIESRTPPIAQVNIDVEKKTRPSLKVASQSRLFPMRDEISQMNPLSAKSDPRPHVSENALLTDVNIKQLVVQSENYGRKEL